MFQPLSRLSSNQEFPLNPIWKFINSSRICRMLSNDCGIYADFIYDSSGILTHKIDSNVYFLPEYFYKKKWEFPNSHFLKKVINMILFVDIHTGCNGIRALVRNYGIVVFK